MQTISSNPQRTILGAVCCVLLLAPCSAAAQHGSGLSPEVVEAAERGRELFDSGQYEEAIDFLLQAYETYEQPIFFQYIGRCYQELERYCEAAEHYQRFLDGSDPSAEVRSQLEERLDELDGRCEVEREAAAAERDQGEREDPTEGPPRRFGGGSEEPPPRSDHRRTDTIGYALLGVGGGLFLPGAGLWIASLPIYVQDMSMQENWLPYSISGDVLGITGLAMMAIGLIVLITGRRRVDRAARASGLAGGGAAQGPSLGLAIL